MVNIVGKYQLIKNENFVEHLVGLGIPEDKAKQADALKPTLEVVLAGKKVSLKSDSGVENSSSDLVLDEEVDEPMPTGVILKSTTKLDGDTLTITSKTPSGVIGTRVHKFTDTELIVTITSENKKAPTAKRYYKRV